ncbi:L domain-like protein [Rhizoclosmatium globosum]|uniref:L domain-like protein n=1 Tax=Rhizoclosmatium globosum TaxID=329046 RepID=A0A1Y2CG67_9FUNG|nr:L domain-like protein [Rhizoclosmatium globosum]|eukprot:ORY45305.1 L domain-like protein [Rhizoclosmatium globosum]
MHNDSPSPSAQPPPVITLESIYHLLVNLQSRFDSHLVSQSVLSNKVECIQNDLSAVRETLLHTHNSVVKLCNPATKYYTRITDLPLELLTLVLSWLDPDVVFKYRRVCKAFDATLMTNQFSVLAVRRYVASDEDHAEVRRECEEDKTLELFGWGTHNIGKLFIGFPKQFQEAAVDYLFPDLESLEIRFTSHNFCKNNSIPTAFGRLHQLKALIIESSGFVGPFPKELCNSTQLEILNLSDVPLNQQLPVAITRIKVLESLTLLNCGLHGSIPAAIGCLINLRHLSLARNNLMGNIPTELGNLQNLLYLALESNKLSGRIPQALCKLEKLERLCLEHNHLTGVIPKEFGNCRKLEYLKMKNNELDGPIPIELGSLPLLRICDLSENHGLTCDFAMHSLKL